MQIRMEHVRAANLCSGGTRGWFARHGQDYNKFLMHGCTEEELIAMNDALAMRVLKVAREMEKAKNE